MNSGVGISAIREWLDPDRAPGGDAVRLRAVRVLDEEGNPPDTIDIRRPFRIEMEYQVLKDGCLLLPHLCLTNEEGVVALGAEDVDPEWRGRRRPRGRYVSSVWMPGNLLAEGVFNVDVTMTTLEPSSVQYQSRSAVSFLVADNLEGDSARGDWTGHMPGVVRPMFRWTTRHVPSAEKDPAPAIALR